MASQRTHSPAVKKADATLRASQAPPGSSGEDALRRSFNAYSTRLDSFLERDRQGYDAVTDSSRQLRDQGMERQRRLLRARRAARIMGTQALLLSATANEAAMKDSLAAWGDNMANREPVKEMDRQSMVSHAPHIAPSHTRICRCLLWQPPLARRVVHSKSGLVVANRARPVSPTRTSSLRRFRIKLPQLRILGLLCRPRRSITT